MDALVPADHDAERPEAGPPAGPASAEETPLGRLRAWPGNPRRITPTRLEDLKRSMAADRGDN